ncbi:MAG: TolB family protein [Nocardioidaceae bacterium]
MTRDDEGSGDGERREQVEFGSAPGRHRLPSWVTIAGVALVAVIAAAVIVVVTTQHDDTTTASPTPVTPTATLPTVTIPTVAGPIAVPPAHAGSVAPPVAVRQLGHSLLGVMSGWELFGLGPNAVVRIQPAAGRITRTSFPGLESSGPVSFVAGSDRAIIRPYDLVPGYVVPDGRPAHRLPSAFRRAGPVIPGPDPGHVWVEAGSGSHLVMELVGMDGSKTGISVAVGTSNSFSVSSDGQGYLMFIGTGGVYDARPNAIRRITTGAVLAVGPTRWLTLECDNRDRCSNVVVDRATGARRALAGPMNDLSADTGVISPDGSTDAVFRAYTSGRGTLQLLDLATGAERSVPMTIAERPFGGGSAVWSPDSRWLFATTANGKLLVVDAHTLRVDDFGVPLPPINQLAFRSAPGTAP